jgi:hypothetical protein
LMVPINNRQRAMAYGRLCNPLVAHPTARRYSCSKPSGGAAGRLERRLEIRLRGRQSVMVRPATGERDTLASLPPGGCAPDPTLSDVQQLGAIQVPVSQEGTLQAVPPLPGG